MPYRLATSLYLANPTRTVSASNAAANAQAGSALPLLHDRADGGRTSHFSSGVETFCSASSLRGGRHSASRCAGGGPGGDRTRNNPVMSRELCQLNYWTV